MDGSTVELAVQDADETGNQGLNRQDFEPAENVTTPLPSADGGKDAWLFLIACFMVEGLVWGFPFAFGIFQQYYSEHEPFAGSSNIAVIGTCSMGVMYLSAPFIFAAMKRWPQIRRISCATGLLIMCTALALSSFSTKVYQLIITQGILYAVGGGIAYSPTILFVNEWFIRRQGLAFGIMWAGTGVAGVVLPILLQRLLSEYGFRTTLRIWSVALFVLTFPLLKFLKPRLPVSTRNPRSHHRGQKLFDFSFLFTRHFLILQACNVIESLGYFLPGIYLPTYAQQTLGSTSVPSAFTVIAINIASVFGCIVMGTLIDRYHFTTCILVSTVGTVVGVFLLWGLARSLTLLYAFGIVYGLFAGSYSSTWTGAIRDVQARTDGAADAGLVFAFLAFGRGVGNVVSGPLSEALVRGRPWLGEAGMGYGTGYGPLITFTGVSALLGGLSFVVKRVGWL